jgi:outer membrane protein assembly factor BamB/tRNA A-37 threonylcarbamoyl transferase component Bud32
VETQSISEDLDILASPNNGQKLTAGTTLVDRYLIQGVLGVGGMGAVYRARDLHFPNVIKLVAVKEMVNQTPDPVVRQTIVRNFEREANLLATLDHRAIPRIYDYFTLRERSYLVEEFVNGKDLEALLRDTPGWLPEEKVVFWAIELCDVLHYLHNHKPEPIIFRDMKPSNIMINAYDHVVLVDFGIAKPFQSGQRGTMIGTEGYSPPEQYRGEATPLVDIYALGATLHHLLTRRDPRLEPPFSFGERPLRQLNSSVSPGLEEVITRALQYNPAERFPNALAMKEALLLAAHKTGVLAQNPMAHDVRDQAEGANTPLWTFRCEDEVRASPNLFGKSIFIGSYDHNLYALLAEDGKFLWKFPTDKGIVSRPVIFDENVLFGSEDGRLYAVDARNGRLNWSYFTNGPVRSSPFYADGHVFIGSDDGQVHAVNLQNGRRAWAVDSGAPVRSTPCVINDYVFFGTENGDFYCVDFSGKIRWHFGARRGITGSPLVSQGVIYVGSMDATLYALDAKTGWVIWRFRLGKGTISTPTIADNRLYTGAADGAIYCIETNSARELWRFTTQHQVTGSPALFKNALYCGSVDGYLYCLDALNGKLLWKFKTQGPITGTPIVADQRVYIGSTDHQVYALMA